MREYLQDRRLNWLSRLERLKNNFWSVAHAEPLRIVVISQEDNLGKHGMRSSEVT